MWASVDSEQIDPKDRQAVADTCWQKFYARTNERFRVGTI